MLSLEISGKPSSSNSHEVPRQISVGVLASSATLLAKLQPEKCELDASIDNVSYHLTLEAPKTFPTDTWAPLRKNDAFLLLAEDLTHVQQMLCRFTGWNDARAIFIAVNPGPESTLFWSEAEIYRFFDSASSESLKKCLGPFNLLPLTSTFSSEDLRKILEVFIAGGYQMGRDQIEPPVSTACTPYSARMSTAAMASPKSSHLNATFLMSYITTPSPIN